VILDTEKEDVVPVCYWRGRRSEAALKVRSLNGIKTRVDGAKFWPRGVAPMNSRLSR
jgi:hypothetical protein